MRSLERSASWTRKKNTKSRSPLRWSIGVWTHLWLLGEWMIARRRIRYWLLKYTRPCIALAVYPLKYLRGLRRELMKAENRSLNEIGFCGELIKIGRCNGLDMRSARPIIGWREIIPTLTVRRRR